MGFNFGNFAGGVAKTWDSKAIGGAINQGMLNSDIQAANDKAEEDKAALEHLQKAQEKQAIRVQDDTMDTPQTIDAGSKKVSDDWIKKQQEASTNNRTQAIKDAYTKWKSPEAYNNYLKSEAEGSKASFEKFVTDGKMAFAQELRDLRNNKGAMVEKAIEMGQLPKGSVFDEKSGQVMVPGQNGQMQVMPIDDGTINSFMDSYELQGWRKFATGMDDYLEGQLAEVTLKTKGDQIEAAGLKNDKTKAEIQYLKDRGAAAKFAAANKSGVKGGERTGKYTYKEVEDGDAIQLDPSGKPTGLKLGPNGDLYEGAFGNYENYQKAASMASDLGIARQVNRETGEERYMFDGKAYPNYFKAYGVAKSKGSPKKEAVKTTLLSKEQINKLSQQNQAQRKYLSENPEAKAAQEAVNTSQLWSPRFAIDPSGYVRSAQEDR